MPLVPEVIKNDYESGVILAVRDILVGSEQCLLVIPLLTMLIENPRIWTFPRIIEQRNNSKSVEELVQTALPANKRNCSRFSK